MPPLPAGRVPSAAARVIVRGGVGILTDSTISAPLGLRSAIALMHAWCSTRFAELGTRALFIKGPVLAVQDLRPAWESSDVDILVHPHDFEVVCELLGANGWNPRPRRSAARFFDDHSVSFVHPEWPCDIDLHRSYPGFLAHPVTVFERLWDSRTAIAFGGVPCMVCSRAANALIMGLHSLRSRSHESRHEREVEYLVQHASFTEEERQEIADVASATGCLESADPFLSRLRLPAPRAPGATVEVSSLDEWLLRTASADTHVWVWRYAFHRTSGFRRAAVLWRAVWPSAADLESEDPALAASGARRMIFRISRLRDGIPPAVRMVRHARRLRAKRIPGERPFGKRSVPSRSPQGNNADTCDS